MKRSSKKLHSTKKNP